MFDKLYRWIIYTIVGKRPIMMNVRIEVDDGLIFVLNEDVIYKNNIVR